VGELELVQQMGSSLVVSAGRQLKDHRGLQLHFFSEPFCAHLPSGAWETQLVEVLPKDLEGSLPTIAQIEAELARPVMNAGKARKQAPAQQKGKRR
jgi:hypothetical protein